VTGAEPPIYEPGDVVYGDDPYKGDEAARPWLIISNHEGRPFHGEQYIALSLTTRTWMDDLIEIDPDEWIRGGTPADSRIVPWGVQSIASDDIDYWQGRLEERLVTEAIESLAAEIRP
jgi:mRNA interferase MazF